MRHVFVTALSLSTAVLLSDAGLGQTPTAHKYLFKAAYTIEGVKDLQNRSATALRGAVGRFYETMGCKLETWYFDYGNSAATGFVDCPDEISAAALAASGNVGGFARVTYRPVLSAEDADRALTKSKGSRPAQQQ
jgi:uncharacterized protein with GYD domain